MKCFFPLSDDLLYGESEPASLELVPFQLDYLYCREVGGAKGRPRGVVARGTRILAGCQPSKRAPGQTLPASRQDDLDRRNS